MKTQTSATLAWGGVLLAGVLWGVGALVAQSVMAHGMQPYSLSLARFALGLPLLWWWHFRQVASGRTTGLASSQWRQLSWRERTLIVGTGLAWSFASAGLYSLVVLGNARMPVHVPAVTASAWSMSVAALLMLAMATLQGVTWPQRGTEWLQVGYIGVFTTSIAYLAFAWGARRLSPTATVVGTLVEPLVAAVASAWLFAQPLTGRQYMGALLLGAAMLLLVRRNAARSREVGVGCRH